MRRFGRKRRRDPEISPDEIFLDASNTADLDQSRFEGRIEQPLSRTTFYVLGAALVLMFFILAGRAWNLEVTHGTAFAAESAQNSLESTTLFAPRGVIEDRNGTVLAQNVEGPSGDMRRQYLIPSMGQIIGYVSAPRKDANGNYYDTKETGLAGLEAQYDSLLTGVNGKLLVERDALGRVKSEGTVVPAQEGGTLKLTIDAAAEKDFAAAIKRVADEQHFTAGAGAIIDVHSGQVLAIASYPSYDPNVMSSGGPAGVIASYNDDPGHPFLDHAVSGVYAPGSIVKPFVAAGALTDGVITPNTVIDDPGYISIPDPYHPGKNFVYTGWKALGKLTVRQAIAWSSDIFFYTVGGGYKSQKGLGIDRLDYWYRQFGIGTTTGIDLPQEASGLVPSPAWKEKTFGKPWYLGDTYFTAIGQYSMQVTPIQMARATAAIANGGTLYTPTLVEGEQLPTSKVPVTQASLQVVKQGMRMGVTQALAHALNLPYVSVAAKTGTAQVGVHNQFDNAWVEGFFPYDNPQYAFAVVLERGPSGAGEQAVNVMRDFLDELHAQNSVYVGGTGTSSTASVAQSTGSSTMPANN